MAVGGGRHQRYRAAVAVCPERRFPRADRRRGAGIRSVSLSLSGTPPHGPVDLPHFQACPAGGAPRPRARGSGDHPGPGPPGGGYLQLGRGRSGCRAGGRPAHADRGQAAAALYQSQFLHQHGGGQSLDSYRCHGPDQRADHGLRHRGFFADCRSDAPDPGAGGRGHLRGGGFLPGGAHRGGLLHDERCLRPQAGAGAGGARQGQPALFP